MDLQKFVDAFFAPTCIISVEKRADGGFGMHKSIVWGIFINLQQLLDSFD